MVDIFLSYATEDRAQAMSVAQALELRGWSIWWDKKIPLGQSFDSVIEEAIAAARCVIVLWSRSSVTSEWVRNEASEGKRRGILVPVFLDRVDAPLAFRFLNGADLSGWQPGTPHAELDRLTERVAEILVQAGGRENAPVPDYRREQPLIAPARPWLRRPWVFPGLAILLVAGVVYAGYLLGTRRPPSAPAGTPATSDRTPETPPSASTNPDALGLEDMLKTLGGGGGAIGGGAMTAFHVLELGLHIAFISPAQAETFLGPGATPGAVVWRLEDGPAQAAGLHVLDVIAAINGQKITTQDDLRRAIRAIGRGTARYLIRRGNETLTIEFDCPACKVT
jgi:hypothetical protein